MAWPKGRPRPEQSERMRKLNADPEFAAKNAERMRKRHADPEFAAKHAERMRKRHADLRERACFYCGRHGYKLDPRPLGGWACRDAEASYADGHRMIAKPLDLRRYERRVFSQSGEDGVLLELDRRLNPPGIFVEIGAGDGGECCGRILAENHWRGVMIDGRVPESERLRALCAHLQRITPLAAFVTCENVHGILSGVPKELGVLIIDVDGNDYHLWKTLCSGERAFRPWVVCIEVNERIRGHYVMDYRADYVWDGKDPQHGASLEAMTELGRELGYECIGVTTEGVNAFFVRNDLLARLQAAE